MTRLRPAWALLWALCSAPALGGEVPPKATVAVLYFDYDGKSDEMGLLKKGLAQMLISDLSGNTAFQVVERTRLQEVLEELKLNQSRKVDPETAGKVGKLLGARYLVLGGYFDLMGKLRIDARVVETETGRIVKSAGGFGKPDDFLEVEQKLAKDIDAILATAANTAPAKPKPSGKKLPASTALRYAKALDAIDRKDTGAAKQELEAVVKEQPDFLLASLDLAALVK